MSLAEGTLVRELKQARRAEVVNSNNPPSGRLPEADAADMETFLDNVRLLLPTLGMNVFAIAGLHDGRVLPTADFALN